jgi:hypothetical protein
MAIQVLAFDPEPISGRITQLGKTTFGPQCLDSCRAGAIEGHSG